MDQMKINEFVEELSSKSPAPGGGSVAALCASLSSALGSMVFNLTVGKKMFNEYDENTKQLVQVSLDKAIHDKDEFLRLMNEDTKCFLELMKAFKLPKENDEDKKIRSEKIQKGYKKALQVPLEVAEKGFNIYEYLMVACEYGNKNAISDAGVAALLVQTAIESAILNVKINLSTIKDKEYKKNISNKCKQLTNEGLEKKNKILKVVNNVIEG
ncbi:cyclodeaminase/cyclohydrolase family protein [Haloimpatiens sp. FM7330]|uniref:cyclodeaminase/cyclohydrolase family protein n=1 Tax=Haloimpatiens sp. FM7330 TaxID=3298610 RepID=UPI003631F4B9